MYMDAAAVSAVLRMRSLQSLWLSVLSDAAGPLAELASLPRLELLDLRLDTAGAEAEADGGAALLRAAAAAVSASPSLQKLHLTLLGPTVDGSAAGDLLRAAKPVLCSCTYETQRQGPRPEVLRALARAHVDAGPRLKRVKVTHENSEAATVAEVGAYRAMFEELAAGERGPSPRHRIKFSVTLKLGPLNKSLMPILAGWASPYSFVQFDAWEIYVDF
eukprot:tig00020964_g16788.t1